MVGGAVAVGLGGILLFSALILLGTDNSVTCDQFGENCTSNAAGAEIGLGVTGGILVAVGIPLLIYGARKVPVAVGPGATIPSPLPKWAGAPAARGWRWQF
jgi:hypothetical protein